MAPWPRRPRRWRHHRQPPSWRRPRRRASSRHRRWPPPPGRASTPRSELQDFRGSKRDALARTPPSAPAPERPSPAESRKKTRGTGALHTLCRPHLPPPPQRPPHRSRTPPPAPTPPPSPTPTPIDSSPAPASREAYKALINESHDADTSVSLRAGQLPQPLVARHAAARPPKSRLLGFSL